MFVAIGRARPAPTRSAAMYGLSLFAILCVALSIPAEGDAKPIRILTIGDSITFGTSSEPAGPGWVEILAERLGAGYAFINVGRSGTSLDWTGLNGGPSLFDSLAARRLPVDVVMIMLGTVDATGFAELAPVSEAQYRRAMQLLVDKTLAAGVERVVLTGPPPAWFSPKGEGRLFLYQGVVADICAATARVRCGPDLYNQLSNRPPDFAASDVHPTAVGHQKIAAAFLPVLQSVFQSIPQQ